MKTILLLHRQELTHFYILISKYLAGKLEVVHVAYSDYEATLLREAGITDYYNYSQITNSLFDTERTDQNILCQIDELLIKQTEGRFTLNASIQSDRGFALLSYQDALLSAQVHYKSWQSIFEKRQIDFLLHEPCSLFFNHLACAMCRKQGGIYMWQSQVKSDIDANAYLIHNYDDYSNIEIERNFRFYCENTDKIDIERCRHFLESFRSDYQIAFADLVHVPSGKMSMRLHKLREDLLRYKNLRHFDSLRQNIDYWMRYTRTYSNKLKNIRNYKKLGVRFESLPESEKYYYYSFHLEPEATVLYLGDGIYANQVKLIENIAASLPAGCYLYVKDHPHELAYRCADDYKRLMNVPNIRLIDQRISGKQVIKDAIGVFSINGTAGFEGLLLRKQVYCFGWSYYCYSPGVNYVKNIRDLRQIIYDNYNVRLTDDTMFYAYINAYLEATHKGFTTYFGGMANAHCADQQSNAKQIAEDLTIYCSQF